MFFYVFALLMSFSVIAMNDLPDNRNKNEDKTAKEDKIRKMLFTMLKNEGEFNHKDPNKYATKDQSSDEGDLDK